MSEKVNFDDWIKLDLRVAKIVSVEDMEGADKLYKIKLDVGPIGERVVCAGLKEYYSKEALNGKLVVYFSNLSPRKLRGVLSEGMLLAASDEFHRKVSLITPDKEMSPGDKIS